MVGQFLKQVGLDPSTREEPHLEGGEGRDTLVNRRIEHHLHQEMAVNDIVEAHCYVVATGE